MKTKTNKTALIPRLRFPEFQNSGEWEKKTLDNLVTDFIVPMRDKPKKLDGDIPWCRIEDFEGMYLSGSKSNQGVSLETIKEMNLKVYPVNTLLVSCSADLGKCAITQKPLITNQTFIGLVPDTKKINTVYLYYLMTNSRDELNQRSSGTTISYLSRRQFEKFEILIPPDKDKKEQQKIASCLSSLDEVIAGARQRLELLNAHKKGLLQNLFPQAGETVPKLRFQEFENSGEWERKELGKISENFDSKRIPITENQREKGTIPYYGASGIIDYVKDYIFDETLLCISEDGANLVARNYPIAFSIHGKTWVNNHAHVLKFDKIYTQTLVENYLNHVNLEDFLTGMAQPKLNRSKLDIIPIPLPPTLKEQEKIADTLSSLDDLIHAHQQKIELLEQHKKGLLQGLFPNVNDVDNG